MSGASGERLRLSVCPFASFVKPSRDRLLMAEDSSRLPALSPEHRKIAAGQFERANQVVAAGDYDYGIHLLLSCCELDPANLIHRQALRRAQKLKYKNNLRGSRLAWLTTARGKARTKRALGGKDYVAVLRLGEQVL